MLSLEQRAVNTVKITEYLILNEVPEKTYVQMLNNARKFGVTTEMTLLADIVYYGDMVVEERSSTVDNWSWSESVIAMKAKAMWAHGIMDICDTYRTPEPRAKSIIPYKEFITYKDQSVVGSAFDRYEALVEVICREYLENDLSREEVIEHLLSTEFEGDLDKYHKEMKKSVSFTDRIKGLAESGTASLLGGIAELTEKGTNKIKGLGSNKKESELSNLVDQATIKSTETDKDAIREGKIVSKKEDLEELEEFKNIQETSEVLVEQREKEFEEEQEALKLEWETRESAKKEMEDELRGELGGHLKTTPIKEKEKTFGSNKGIEKEKKGLFSRERTVKEERKEIKEKKQSQKGKEISPEDKALEEALQRSYNDMTKELDLENSEEEKLENNLTWGTKASHEDDGEKVDKKEIENGE